MAAPKTRSEWQALYDDPHSNIMHRNTAARILNDFDYVDNAPPYVLDTARRMVAALGIDPDELNGAGFPRWFAYREQAEKYLIGKALDKRERELFPVA